MKNPTNSGINLWNLGKNWCKAWKSWNDSGVKIKALLDVGKVGKSWIFGGFLLLEIHEGDEKKVGKKIPQGCLENS